MKPLRSLLLLALFHAGTATMLCAQKKTITNDTYKTWTELKDMAHRKSCVVSNDGRYVAYQYETRDKKYIGVRSMDGRYKKDMRIASEEIAFTEDNRKLIFMQSGDSLCILALGTDQLIVKTGVNAYSMPGSGTGKWLAYKTSGAQPALVLMDLAAGREDRYDGVEEFKFNEGGEVLLARTSSTVLCIDVASRKVQQIASGGSANVLTFSPDAKQATFLMKGENGLELRYYKSGMDSAAVLANHQSVPPDMSITSEGYPGLQFSPDGSRIFFNLAKKSPPKNDEAVRVWSYKDPFLMTNETLTNKTFLAAAEIASQRIVPLGRQGYWVWHSGNRFALIYTIVNRNEMYWNNALTTVKLVNVKDGSDKNVAVFKGSQPIMLVSPDERYLVWFDPEKYQYHSYEIATGVTRNISSDISYPLCDKENEILERSERWFGTAGWCNKNSILVYDQYDIWQLDVTGQKKPVNITDGYGRKNQIMLRRPVKYEEAKKEVGKEILLAGFNTVSKYNGFFWLSLKGGRQLTAGKQGPCLYSFPAHVPGFIDYLYDEYPQKARHASVWVVKKMSVKESANLFSTKDFKTFTPLTDIHPEKEYNWLTSELVRWKMPNGKTGEGILYKPEHFDPVKKYPVIFHYYEKLSDALNVFPGAAEGELTSGLWPTWGIINIPWYVSNGYLVFVPNMYLERGQVENSVVSTITSAVQHLSSACPFIDTAKMGLQGHSFGGEETVMLIARTNLFAAAQATAGLVNSTAYYNHILGGSANRNHYFDRSQGNLAVTPWERPDIFINNSPIFRVHQIQTPLFIMHNKGDDNVPLTQGIELFTAMRRLQKPVWLLDYGKEESHQVGTEKNQMDFTIKQQQFFGHFLKGEPAPDWMQTK